MQTAKRRREGRGKYVERNGELFYSVSASNDGSADGLDQEQIGEADRFGPDSALLPHQYQFNEKDKDDEVKNKESGNR